MAGRTPFGMGYTIGSLGWLSWLYPHLSPCGPLAPSQAGQHMKQERSWFCAATALQQLRHQCAITSATNFINSPKHNVIQASAKKINTIPVKTMTWAENVCLQRYSN